MKKQKIKRVDASLGIGNRQAQVAMIEADNPLYAPVHAGASGNPKKITVAINLRESPIALMFAKGHIDQSQLAAANQFRRLWEAMGGAGAGAMDYTREPVDGGGAREPITDRQIDAGLRLKEAQAHIGRRAFDVVQKVCGEGVGVSDLGTSHRERTTYADYLKHALTDLGKLWGYETKAGNAQIRRRA